MSRAIKQLTLRSFRGATQPVDIELDTNKPLVVIFGENGCGKSSLIDAVDFIANRSFGSLMHRSVDGQRHPFLASLGHDLADIEIRLETQDGGAWTAKLSNRQASVARTSDTGELPVVRVLRRAEILDIVEATPAKRYEALGRFIDVSSYESSETALRLAFHNAETSLQQAAARVEQASSSLEKYWEAEASPGASAEAWGKAKAQEVVIELEKREAALKVVEQAVSAVGSRRIEFGRGTRNARAAAQTLSKVQDELKQLPDLEAVDAVSLVALLREATPLVAEGTDTRECPLCLQPIRGEELRKSIEERLSKLDDYVQLADRLSQAEKNSELKTAVRNSARASLLGALCKLVEAADEAQAELTSEGKTLLASLQDALNADSEEPTREAIQAGRQLSVILSSFSEVLATVSSDLAKHSAIRVQHEALMEAKKEGQHQEQLVARLKRAPASIPRRA